MRSYTLLFILVFASLSGFAQTLKGLYFQDIKGTTWISSKNISDSTVLDASEMYLSMYELKATDTLSRNIWIFADSLIIKFYDAGSKQYKTILTCAYNNDETNKKLLLRLNNGKEITFEYNSVSTGSYIGLYKKKKKK